MYYYTISLHLELIRHCNTILLEARLCIYLLHWPHFVVESAASHQPLADYPVLITFPRFTVLPMDITETSSLYVNCTQITMSSELNLKPVKNEASGSRPQPTASILKPWEFDYAPSKDGKDLNLLIMFHGLGKSLYFPMSRAKV